MGSLLDARDREAIAERVLRLEPDSPRQWGRLDAPRMLTHAADALRLALGELSAEPMRSPLRNRAIRHAVIHWLPWPKGAKTAPEVFTTKPKTWEGDRRMLVELMERLAAAPRDRPWPPHPLFGDISVRDWGVLQYRHLDHHLRQFSA